MTPLRKVSLADTVYKELLTMIRAGEFVPGDKLPIEAELCERLGVSRTALREGIKALVFSNVLKVMPGRGTFLTDDPEILVASDVLQISLKRVTIESLHEVRTVLDTGIARYAAIKATDEDFKALESALLKMTRAIEKMPPDSRLAIEGDEDFHFALCKAAHNRVLEKVAWPIVNHSMLRRRKELNIDAKLIEGAIKGHQKIVQAIKQKDPVAAALEMERHLEEAYNVFYRPIKSL